MARILVVDDDQSILSVFRQVLEAEGHEVIEAQNGTVALERFREQPADLVITDMYMPDTDGIEAMIRLEAENPAVRIVAMSGGGWTDKGSVLDLAAQLGAVASLEKPFSRDEILAVVRRVLSGAGER